MTLLPRSLLVRSFLLLGLLIITSILIGVGITRYNEREPRARQIANQVTSVVNLSRTALIAVPRENRRYLLTQMLYEEGIRIYPGYADEPAGRTPQRPFAKLVAREIAQRLGPDTRVEFGRQGVPGLWVSFQIEDDRYWVALPRVLLERPIQIRFWLWIGASMALALLGAWLIAWHINRPLKALAKHAASIGQGMQPQPLAEQGPEETRKVIRSVNRMNQDLAKLNQERNVMLAGISHDLRTPLARLRLAVEMQEGKTDAETQAGMVQDIADMDAIISQFLAFARGLDNEASIPTDLNQLLRETQERYARSGKHLDLELGSVPTMNLRPLAMQRLLTNLIDNALRYGGEPITLQTLAQPNAIQLSVLDRVPGIPAEETNRVLQPFQRLQAARTDASGAGLGLAIVAQVAQMHGGQLMLLPRVGGGLEARVTVPTEIGRIDEG